jgi:hypothetical protein
VFIDEINFDEWFSSSFAQREESYQTVKSGTHAAAMWWPAHHQRCFSTVFPRLLRLSALLEKCALWVPHHKNDFGKVDEKASFSIEKKKFYFFLTKFCKIVWKADENSSVKLVSFSRFSYDFAKFSTGKSRKSISFLRWKSLGKSWLFRQLCQNLLCGTLGALFK